MIILDANNQVLGRLAAYAAKQALLGEKIEIVNSEKAVITGTKQNVLARYKAKRSRGDPFHGPFISRNPEALLRRTIRGMLPHKQVKGLAAYKRVHCHKGIPEVYNGKEFKTVKGTDVSKMSNLKFMTLGEVSKLLGGRL